MPDHDPAEVRAAAERRWTLQRAYGICSGRRLAQRIEDASILADAYLDLCGPDGTPPVSRAATGEVVELLGEIKGAVVNYDVVRRILKLLGATDG